MTSPSDQLLAEQVRQGNEQALVRLIRRYERTLVGLIRHRVGSGDQGAGRTAGNPITRLEQPAPGHSHYYDNLTDVACGIVD